MKKTQKLTDRDVEDVLDIIRRRNYWREVGEVMKLAIYKAEGFWSLRERQQDWNGKPKVSAKPLTLGEILDRLPKEEAEKLLQLDGEWLISLLAPSHDTSLFGAEVRVIQPPDARGLGQLDVSPPRILETAKATATAKKKAAKKATAMVKKATATAKKATATAKKATKTAKPTATAKKATATAKKAAAAPVKRRSQEQLEHQMLALADVAPEAKGMTKAQIRAELGCSGTQVNKAIDALRRQGTLVQRAKGRYGRPELETKAQTKPKAKAETKPKTKPKAKAKASQPILEGLATGDDASNLRDIGRATRLFVFGQEGTWAKLRLDSLEEFADGLTEGLLPDADVSGGGFDTKAWTISREVGDGIRVHDPTLAELVGRALLREFVESSSHPWSLQWWGNHTRLGWNVSSDGRDPLPAAKDEAELESYRPQILVALCDVLEGAPRPTAIERGEVYWTVHGRLGRIVELATAVGDLIPEDHG